MKKVLGTCFTTLLAINFAISGSNNVFAQDDIGTNSSGTNPEESTIVTLSKSEISDLNEYREDMVSTLKKLDDSTDISETIPDVISPEDDVLAEKIIKSSSTVNAQEINVVSNAPVETFEINENTTLTFDDQFIILDELGGDKERLASPEEEEAFDEETMDKSALGKVKQIFMPKAYAASTHIINKHYTRSVYDADFKKWKIVTAHIAAEFTYNGSKVTARRTANYVKSNGIAPFLSIYDKQSAVQKPSTKRRIAYQSASLTLGVNIFDNHLSYQDMYVRINLECNQDGKISKSFIAN